MIRLELTRFGSIPFIKIGYNTNMRLLRLYKSNSSYPEGPLVLRKYDKTKN